jgi:cytoskeletal protein CcmA (bactofilin family)
MNASAKKSQEPSPVKPLVSTPVPEAPLLRSVEKSRGVQNLVSDLSLSVEEDLKRRFGGNIRSALGPGTVIEGTFRFDSPVRIDGTLRGEVASSSVLIVGEDARVEASIEVGSLIILGNVEGTIEAEELIEIRGEGNLEGSVFTKRIVIEDGATFNGSCRIVR